MGTGLFFVQCREKAVDPRTPIAEWKLDVAPTEKNVCAKKYIKKALLIFFAAYKQSCVWVGVCGRQTDRQQQ